MALRCVAEPLRFIWRCNMLSYNLIKTFDRENMVAGSFMTKDLGKQMIFIPKRFAKRSIVKEQKGKKFRPKVELTEEEMMQVINVTLFKSQLKNVLDKLRQNYTENLSLHTGAGFLENIIVKINDCEYSLNQIAQVSRKGSNLAVLNLASFPEGLKPALQAIQESGMNLNPQQDGTVIYVPLPKVTREHRENLAKNAKVLLNQAKDEIREIQNKFSKEAKHQTGLSEDLIFNCQQQMKAIIQNVTEEGEQMMQNKQKELLSER